MPSLLHYVIIVRNDIVAKKKYFLDMPNSEDYKIKSLIF